MMMSWFKRFLTVLKIYLILIYNIHVEDEKVRYGYYKDDYAIQ